MLALLNTFNKRRSVIVKSGSWRVEVIDDRRMAVRGAVAEDAIAGGVREGKRRLNGRKGQLRDKLFGNITSTLSTCAG